MTPAPQHNRVHQHDTSSEVLSENDDSDTANPQAANLTNDHFTCTKGEDEIDFHSIVRHIWIDGTLNLDCECATDNTHNIRHETAKQDHPFGLATCILDNGVNDGAPSHAQWHL